jgi:hypothetical protein
MPAMCQFLPVATDRFMAMNMAYEVRQLSKLAGPLLSVRFRIIRANTLR